MSNTESWASGHPRFMDRWHARLSRLFRTTTRFTTDPEPRMIGSVARGKQVAIGKFHLAGHLLEAPGKTPWDLDAPDAAFTDEAHGFAWLDDLVAAGDVEAWIKARTWTLDWMDRFGNGSGPGWQPETAGRRLVRLINHAMMLHGGWDEADQERFLRLLTQHVMFLAKRWRATRSERPKLEALTGLVYGAVTLEGMERYADPAIKAIARETRRRVDEDGGIAARNPEELLEIFMLLTLSASVISEDGRIPEAEHLEAIERIAPSLRVLRHADGGLARFHGGGRGLEGRLDQALAASGIRATQKAKRAMGFVRLTGGRTTVIQDAAPPPISAAPFGAHASTLAFELTSGRRPVVVNCGSGDTFGPEWRRAGRATPSHSTLGIEGYSSSRLSEPITIRGQPRERVIEGPTDVRLQQNFGHYGSSALTGHNGYQMTHGLTHVRRLDLSLDGRTLSGEDTLAALSDADRRRLQRMRERLGVASIPYTVRFHLHPDVDVEIGLGGTAVSIALKSGEIWEFRHDGHARLSLEPSVYLEKGRLRPRSARQIVLAAEVADHASQVGWTLAKAQDTPHNIRDLKRDEPVYDL